MWRWVAKARTNESVTVTTNCWLSRIVVWEFIGVNFPLVPQKTSFPWNFSTTLSLRSYELVSYGDQIKKSKTKWNNRIPRTISSPLIVLLLRKTHNGVLWFLRNYFDGRRNIWLMKGTISKITNPWYSCNAVEVIFLTSVNLWKEIFYQEDKFQKYWNILIPWKYLNN